MSAPLEGYRIVDLGRAASAPFAALMLADMGAEVIKIEDIDGNFDRSVGGPHRGGVDAFFLNANRNKKSVAVDLRSTQGKNVARTLIASADVVIANFRPGVLEAIGLGFADIQQLNERTVLVEINGFGSSGPYRDDLAFDPVIQGLSGMINMQRRAGTGEPDVIHNMIADKLTAMFAANAALTALLARERHGHGQRVEVPMLDAALYFNWLECMADHTFVGEFTDGWMGVKHQEVTKVRDGTVVFMAISYRQRFALLEAIDRQDLQQDPRFSTRAELTKRENLAALYSIVADAARGFDKDDFIKQLAAVGVPCGPILNATEVIADRHVGSEGLVVEWDDPVVGTIRSARYPSRFSADGLEPALELRPLGGDGPGLLRELGWTEDQVRAAVDSGGLNPGPPAGS